MTGPSCYSPGQLAIRRDDPVLFRQPSGLSYCTGTAARAPFPCGGVLVVRLDQMRDPLPLRDVFPSDLPARAEPYQFPEYAI